MSIYLPIIIICILGAWLIEIITATLNIRSLKPKLPEEFADTFDAEKYARSQEYTRITTRFSMIKDTFSTFIILAMILLGGFAWLDTFVHSLHYSPIISGLLFFALIGLGSELMDLPFNIYGTFHIEEQFGFNKTTAKTFITDKLKGYALTAAIGGPLLAAFLWFFGEMGAQAWLYCLVVYIVVVLLIQYIAPTWILPLFNKFTPIEDGELKTAIEKLLKDTGYESSGVFVIDGSRRSAKSNAFFTGFGKRKRIALFDTLIEQLTVEETVGVLAHEIGHCKKGHIRRMMVWSFMQMGVMFWLLGYFLSDSALFSAFGVKTPEVYTGLLFFSLLYTPVSLFLSIAGNSLSRQHEYEADDFAKEETGSPEPLISALKRLSVENLSNLTPHPFAVAIHYSHPPVIERIAALRK